MQGATCTCVGLKITGVNAPSVTRVCGLFVYCCLRAGLSGEVMLVSFKILDAQILDAQL